MYASRKFGGSCTPPKLCLQQRQPSLRSAAPDPQRPTEGVCRYPPGLQPSTFHHFNCTTVVFVGVPFGPQRHNLLVKNPCGRRSLGDSHCRTNPWTPICAERLLDTNAKAWFAMNSLPNWVWAKLKKLFMASRRWTQRRSLRYSKAMASKKFLSWLGGEGTRVATTT